MAQALLYSSCGFAVGALVGLTGVGGGSLMTPLLVIVFGQSPMAAVGTDLLFSSATKLAATTTFAWKRCVDWRVVGRLLVGSLPAAVAVSLLLSRNLLSSQATQQLISHALATLLAITALALIFGPSLMTVVRKTHSKAMSVRNNAHRTLLTVGMGLLLGAAITLTSVGAGALGILALAALYSERTVESLVATDIAHGLLITSVAAAGHAVSGHIDFHAVGWLLVGSLPGVLLAARMGSYVPPQVARRLIAGMLGIVSVRLVLI